MNELPSAKQAARYQTYLITCWQERDTVLETAVWRFRLETPCPGKRHIFTTLEEVMSIIKAELSEKSSD